MGIRRVYQPDAFVAGEAAHLAGKGEFAKERDRFNLEQDKFAFTQSQADRDYQLRLASFMQNARNQQIANSQRAQQANLQAQLSQQRLDLEAQKAAASQGLLQQKAMQDAYQKQQDRAYDIYQDQRGADWEREKLGLQNQARMDALDSSRQGQLERMREEHAWRDAATQAENIEDAIQQYEGYLTEQLGAFNPNNLTESGRQIYDDLSRKFRGIMDSQRFRNPQRLEALQNLIGELQTKAGNIQEQPPFNAQEMFGEGGANFVEWGNGAKGVIIQDSNGNQRFNQLREEKAEDYSHIADPFGQYVASLGDGGPRKMLDLARKRHAEEWKHQNADRPDATYSPPSQGELQSLARKVWQEEMQFSNALGITTQKDQSQQPTVIQTEQQLMEFQKQGAVGTRFIYRGTLFEIGANGLPYIVQ